MKHVNKLGKSLDKIEVNEMEKSKYNRVDIKKLGNKEFASDLENLRQRTFGTK